MSCLLNGYLSNCEVSNIFKQRALHLLGSIQNALFFSRAQLDIRICTKQIVISFTQVIHTYVFLRNQIIIGVQPSINIFSSLRMIDRKIIPFSQPVLPILGHKMAKVYLKLDLKCEADVLNLMKSFYFFWHQSKNLSVSSIFCGLFKKNQH